REVPNPLDFITNLPTDWRDWVADNFRLRYWPQISLIAASTALMILYDNQLWTPFEKEYNRNSSFRNTADLFVDVGDGRFQFGLSAAYLAYGVIASDKRAIRCASEITEVILASGGVVQLLKHITGRQSPIDISANPTGVWDWFPNQIDYLHHTSNYDAFPSGHLTTVLATLVVIANNYPEQAWIRPVGYAICTGVAAGLVAQSVHWWSDFPLAIALGIGFGDLLSPNPNADVSVPTKAHETGSLETTISHLLAQTTFAPTYVPDGAGLGMTLRF
ncbi:MAG TPA: phosphatase PAP2 family protein, partial [Candidatus Kapabacteria bacterium]